MGKYVDKKEFLDMIIEYKESENVILYNKMGRIFLLIATNCLNRWNSIGYTDDIKDEVISEATYNMCRYVKTYNDKKFNNPFGWCSIVTQNALKYVLNKRKTHNDRYVSLSFIENFDTDVEIDKDIIF